MMPLFGSRTGQPVRSTLLAISQRSFYQSRRARRLPARQKLFGRSKIAEAIAARASKCTVNSALRFIEARPSSREEGGTRDPKVLYPNMTMISAIQSGTLVLVDDVMTSGGSLHRSQLETRGALSQAFAWNCLWPISGQSAPKPFFRYARRH